MTQAQLDALMALMQGGGPRQGAALDLPDYQAFTPQAFNDQYYTDLQNQWAGAVNTDVATAQQGTQNLIGLLTQNYQNAYTNPNNTYATAGQAPGMDQASMARMLQAQGVNPNVMAGEMAARAGADQAFGNVWRSGAATEDTAQRGRLGAAAMGGQDAVNRINAQGLAGRAGINMQRGQAKSAYDQVSSSGHGKTRRSVSRSPSRRRCRTGPRATRSVSSSRRTATRRCRRCSG